MILDTHWTLTTLKVGETTVYQANCMGIESKGPSFIGTWKERWELDIWRRSIKLGGRQRRGGWVRREARIGPLRLISSW